LISNIGNICEEVVYNDPDKDFEILDDGDNSGSLSESTSNLSSTYNTNITNVDANIYDLHFDKTAIEVARVYANSASQTLQEQVEETGIDWLEPDLDTASSGEPLWEVDGYQEDELEMKIGSKNTKQPYSTCVLLDDSNGILQRCSKPTHRPLKQLVGIWD
ncbi:1506_t:CDS:1, partial [Cetraspora pellucida]